MDRAEFMRRLSELLQDVPPAEREEALQYYNDYLDDAGEGNEVSVIASLGTPEELAKSIKAGLSDGGNAGEFTESGFRTYEQGNRNQVMSTEGMQTGGQHNAQGGAGNGGFGGSAYGQQAQSAYGAYGQPTNGAQNADVYGAQVNAGQQKKSMSGDRIALIVILAILTSPIWIGVLGAAFGCVVGLLAALLGIFIAVFVVAVVFLAVGGSLFVSGFAGIFAAPLPGICLVGVGLILFALGLLFGCLMVWMIAAAIPAVVRACVNLCSRVFHRTGGAKA